MSDPTPAAAPSPGPEHVVGPSPGGTTPIPSPGWWDGRYRDAAVRAGEFYRELTAGTFHFVGGTADHPNVLDEEGGAPALRAFLAVHDATGEERWLAEARRAADFTGSWLFSWPYEIDPPPGLPEAGRARSEPDRRRRPGDRHLAHLLGRGLLPSAPAHPGPALPAGDQDLTSLADRTTQFKGNDLGYDRDGLLEEAITLSSLVYDGVGTWLPWCSLAQLEPLSVPQDRFGSMDLRRIQLRLLAERQDRNRRAGTEV